MAKELKELNNAFRRKKSVLTIFNENILIFYTLYVYYGITLKKFQFPDSLTRFPKEWISIPRSPRIEKMAFLDGGPERTYCISSWGEEAIQVFYLWSQMLTKGALEITYC